MMGITKVRKSGAVDAVFEGIVQALAKGEEASFVGFGVFSVKKREARMGRNPRTNTEAMWPEVNLVKFKAGKKMREGANIS